MIKGIVFSALFAALCSYIGGLFPVIGGPIIAIFAGIIINNTTKIVEQLSLEKGLNYTSKKLLQYSIILMGFGFNIKNIFNVGLSSLSVTVATLAAAFISMVIAGKFLKTNYSLSNLIGVGTAICGGSAIAAVAPVIKADDQDISYAVSTIFLFNIIAALIFPPLGSLMKMSSETFGLWTGTAVNDTSSVLVAGFRFSQTAGEYATIVKLTRTTFIVPVAAIYTVIEMLKNKSRKNESSSLRKIFPWFIFWFMAAAMINSILELPEFFTKYAKISSKFLIVMALGAIGLKTDFRKIIASGVKPLFLGLVVWMAVIFTSLAFI